MFSTFITGADNPTTPVIVGLEQVDHNNIEAE
jgi:hypothetical protein